MRSTSGDRQTLAVHVAALDDQRLVFFGAGLDGLGRVDRSPRTKAMAVGPTNSSSSPSTPASDAARLISVFLATV